MENRSKDIQREAQGRKMDGKYKKSCAICGTQWKGSNIFQYSPTRIRKIEKWEGGGTGRILTEEATESFPKLIRHQPTRSRSFANWSNISMKKITPRHITVKRKLHKRKMTCRLLSTGLLKDYNTGQQSHRDHELRWLQKSLSLGQRPTSHGKELVSG